MNIYDSEPNSTQNHYISERLNVEELTFYISVTLVCMIAR